MEEEKLEKSITLTKKGFPAMWVQTSRVASPNSRFGISCTVCDKNGRQTKIMRTLKNYTKVRHLVRLTDKCVFIQSQYNIDGNDVKIYKVSNINTDTKKAELTQVASFEDGKWDNTSYLKKYKIGIHSTLMRAKKFYCLMDLD